MNQKGPGNSPPNMEDIGYVTFDANIERVSCPASTDTDTLRSAAPASANPRRPSAPRLRLRARLPGPAVAHSQHLRHGPRPRSGAAGREVLAPGLCLTSGTVLSAHAGADGSASW